MKKFLNFIFGLILIFLINYLSAFILKTFNIPFPSPILGIIILFTLLKTKLLKEELVQSFCDFILKYMILFFIPLFVGLISFMPIIIKNFLSIIMTILITTTLVMISVGLSYEWIVKLKRLYRMKGRLK